MTPPVETGEFAAENKTNHPHAALVGVGWLMGAKLGRDDGNRSDYHIHRQRRSGGGSGLGGLLLACIRCLVERPTTN
jgi:hypothetical protein